MGGHLSVFQIEPVHFLRERGAKLVEHTGVKKPLPHRPKHPRLDLVTADSAGIGAGAAGGLVETAEHVARRESVPAATDAALRQLREQVQGSTRLNNACLHRLSCRSLPSLYGLPEVVIDNTQLRHVLDNPLRFCIRSGNSFAGVRVF